MCLLSFCSCNCYYYFNSARLTYSTEKATKLHFHKQKHRDSPRYMSLKKPLNSAKKISLPPHLSKSIIHIKWYTRWFKGMWWWIQTYVVFPYAFPISLETVSLSLVQKLATKPSCQSWESAFPPIPYMERSAHTQPAALEPITLPGPLLPFLFSATPWASFCAILTLVAAVP